jgi:hypothetical protein
VHEGRKHLDLRIYGEAKLGNSETQKTDSDLIDYPDRWPFGKIDAREQ